MRIIILQDAEQVADIASSRMARLVQAKPAAVLGLATGGTPVATYRCLVSKVQQGLDMSQVTTFNLDEYFGLAATSPQSYRSFMNEHLFHPAAIPLAQTHLLNGLATDIVEECARYEALIRQQGGLDLQLLGIGRDGHIGFNEPGSSLASRTRWMLIADETIQDNAHYFGGAHLVPKAALTMGVGTILEAKQILLLATGKAKAEAVEAMIEGPVTAQVTASALQLHPSVTIVIDEAAASRLARRQYYLDSEKHRQAIGL